MNKLIESFKGEKRWLNWQYQKTADGKMTKVPLGSSTNKKTWHMYTNLKKGLPFGIVFTPDQLLLGIDIDHCINPATLAIEHPDQALIQSFLDVADTYTELSPSNTGVHLFFKLTSPLALQANKHAPFECYTSGRFFTVTTIPYPSDPANPDGKPIRLITPTEAVTLLTTLGYPWGKKIASPTALTLQQDNRLTSSDVLDRMFASKNGTSIRALYNGDTKEYDDDLSSADMALCSHLAYWTAKDHLLMEKLWIASPLGSRNKTQQRVDYRTRTIQNAIDHCTSVYTPPARVPDELDLLFTWNSKKEKNYTLNTENICRILHHHSEFKGRFRYDEFTNVFEIKIDNKWQPFKDSDTIDIQTRISVLFDFFQKVGKDMVFDAIVKVSYDNKIDSAADYLRSLVWDDVPRLDTWLTAVYGAKDDAVTRAIGSNWLKGLVHRIVEPGCKFDYVLVLESDQGMGKSTSLNVLGNGWHVETTMSTDSKDFFMQFAGKAIIEFSEGETLSRTEVKKMKAIITMQSDKYRPPYERVSRDFPRRCVFAMTTNQTEYLKDETGNRRWLPISCTKMADITWLKANRDQLFAEAYHRVARLKEKTYEFPEDDLEAEQSLRRIANPWEEMIFTWYFGLTDSERMAGITTNMAYQKGVQNGQPFSKEISTLDSMIVGGILRNVLKLVKQRTMKDGERDYLYYPSEKTMRMMPKTIAVADLAEQQFKDF